MHQQQTTEIAFHYKEIAKDLLWHKDNRHSSIYQKPPVSEPIPLHLSVFHSPLVLSAEYYGLEFLDATYSLSLEITEHNKEQQKKDYSGLSV